MRKLWLVFLLSCFGVISCKSYMTEGEIPYKVFPVPEYVVKAGDTLNISVLDKEDLSGQSIVSPDGKIRLLLVGEVEVVGKTLNQIQDEATARYVKFLRNPVVEVSLAIPNFEVYVFGEIGPQVIALRQNITLLELLIRAGGIRPQGDPTNVFLVRRIPGKEIRYRFNLDTYLSGEDINQNIYLQPGDIIYVPPLPF